MTGMTGETTESPSPTNQTLNLAPEVDRPLAAVPMMTMTMSKLLEA
jgi:hypothetical protein